MLWLKRFLGDIRLGMSLMRYRGVKYVYNRWYLRTFYAVENPLRNFIYFRLYPLIDYTPFPSMIEIEATTTCNLRCTICEHTHWNEPPRNMTLEEFKGIIDQFPEVRAIALTGIGENFLNKDFLKMYEYIRERWPSAFIELYDNFYLVGEDVSRRLIDLSIDRVIISMEAATKDTYEKIRVGSNFERVLENIKNFVEIKSKENSPFPEIFFHFIVTNQNIHELPSYIKLVKGLGCVKISITNLLHPYHEVQHMMLHNIPEGIIKEAESVACKEGITLLWNSNIPQKKPPITNCNNWIMPFIYVTGHVVPCCSMNEANVRQFQKDNSFGNVFEKPFKEIWYSDEFKAFRRAQRKGEVPVLCRDCPMYDVGRRIV